jgi:hypothetical protein
LNKLGEVRSGFREAELLYDWRFTAYQFGLATSPLRLTTSNFIFQLNTCGYSPYVTSSSNERMGLSFTIAAGLASAVILRSETCGSHDHILLSQIPDSPNLEGQFPVFVSPRNRVARLYPQALGSLFVPSYDSQGYSGGIRPASTWDSSVWVEKIVFTIYIPVINMPIAVVTK